MHEQGAVHGRIRPACIALCENGTLKLSPFDFEAVNGDWIRYMSPEQLTTGTKSEASDCWAFGMVCYQASDLSYQKENGV